MSKDKIIDTESAETAHDARVAISDAAHTERAAIGDRADAESARATSSDIQMALDIGMLKEAVANIDKTLSKVDATLTVLLSLQTETALLKQWKERFEPEHIQLMEWKAQHRDEDEKKVGREALSTKIWRGVALVMTTIVALHEPISKWVHNFLQWVAKHG